MKVNIFILCYNEEILLPHTIQHYKKYLPNCCITILDNYSVDNSVKIAEELGCKIHYWKSKRHEGIDDLEYINLKNNFWKSVKNEWIIMCDMDEWLCLKESDLIQEARNGVTIITTNGVNVVGDSKLEDLSDIDLHVLNKGIPNSRESKYLCFLSGKIKEIHYGIGAHNINPIGIIKYSNNVYYNKHMCYLGLEFYRKKMKDRYTRILEQRKEIRSFGCHYTNSDKVIEARYNKINNTITFDFDKPILKQQIPKQIPKQMYTKFVKKHINNFPVVKIRHEKYV